jgi:sialic acid synthase SpsE
MVDIGDNHQGDLSLAKEMVLAAKENGGDAVKFQTRNPKDVYSVAEYNRVSDNPNWFGKTYGEHREHLELSEGEWDGAVRVLPGAGDNGTLHPFRFQEC